MTVEDFRSSVLRIDLTPPRFSPKSAREHLRIPSSACCLGWSLQSQTVGEGLLECAYSPNADAAEFRSPQRDQVLWTARISQHNKCGQYREALGVYEDLRKGGFRPGSYMFVAALKACSSLHDLRSAQKIHAEVVKSGLEGDIYVGSMLVDVYAKCGSLVDARRVFEKMPYRNVVSWTAMILGYVQVDECEVALQLYTRMQQERAVPNDRTFVCALKACSRLAWKEKKQGGRTVMQKRSLDQVRTIHLDVMKGEFRSDAFVASMLVDVYVNCGSLLNARHVFDQMKHRDVVSWTVMILGYVHMQEADEALQLYEQMQQEGVVPDGRAFLGALKAVSALADSEGNKHHDKSAKQWYLKKVRAIHSQILALELESDVHLGTMLVDVYAKCGRLVDARHIFERLTRRDVVCWTAMILGYAQTDEGAEALMLYARMQQEGVAPDERAFVGALKACGCVAALDKGKEIHAQISKTGVKATDLFLANSLIDMYGKCGSMVDAQQVFDVMQDRDVVTWSALIAGYAHQGESETVFSLFQRMTQNGIQPNAITFLSILTVCSHLGLLDKGQKFFEAMNKDFGITPGIEHYTCMVDLLGRGGQVHTAMMIALTMPFQPDGVVWEIVLGACQKWGNVDIGRQAFEYAMVLDKNDPGAYVLMSNIYYTAHMWEEAKKIQEMRLKVQGWKQAGRSVWTDIGGVVYTFMAGHSENPRCQGTYSSLQDLFVKVMVEGCKLQPHSMLEGGGPLCGYSEKLSIAYALLNIREGYNAYLLNNLPVCDHCDDECDT